MRLNFNENLASAMPISNRRSKPVPSRGPVVLVLLLLIASAGSEAAQHNEQANPVRIPSTANPMHRNNERDYFHTFVAAPPTPGDSVASVGAMAMQSQSYQLRCRGARTEREMQFSIEKSHIKGFNKLVVGFQFGARPAPKGLNPGQCSWIDRAMRQGEPLRLEENIPENSQSAADYLRKPYNYWTFYVYNTGKGYFQVTKSHFGQPMNY
jgi:hypothetical protein